MLSNIIENILHSVDVSTVTDIFIIVTLLLLFLSIVWTKLDKHHEFTSYAPSLLTSVGILGTFTGIVIGLLSFNVTNIDGSIESLLEGLKVAFITSLVGMLSSIILKFLTSSNMISPSQKEDIKEDITIKDLYSIMKHQNDNLIKVQELLSDSADSSLIGQIKLMRSDISDNNKLINKNLEEFKEPLEKLELLTNINKSIENSNISLKVLENNYLDQKALFEQFSKELWKELENFADILSKSATEQIIEALKNVIAEFNDKLTEQFGQNFKELNSAVKDLVIWQDNYKIQLSDMKDQFNLSVTSMSDMEKSIELISTNSKSIPEHMDNLKNVMTVNQHQIDELSNHLEAFKDIRDKAVEAIPEIRTQIDTTIKGIHEASISLVEGVTESTDKISSVIVQSADDFANNVNSTNGALVETSNTLTKSSTDIKDQLNLTVQDINKHLREMIENLSVNSKEISDNFKAIGTSLKTEFTSANKDMIDNFKSISTNLSDSSKTINKEFEISSKKITETLLNTSSELKSNIEDLSQKQLEQTNKVLNNLDKSIEKTLQDTKNSLSKQIETMDKATEHEINNVMKSLGEKLGSITQKFTKDYSSLVSEMHKVIESNR